MSVVWLGPQRHFTFVLLMDVPCDGVLGFATPYPRSSKDSDASKGDAHLLGFGGFILTVAHDTWWSSRPTHDGGSQEHPMNAVCMLDLHKKLRCATAVFLLGGVIMVLSSPLPLRAPGEMSDPCIQTMVVPLRPLPS